MYQEEILKIIHKNYEYMILDENLIFIEGSKGILKFFNLKQSEVSLLDIFELMPEFIGMENDFKEVLNHTKESFVIPKVFKSPTTYIDIHIQQGKNKIGSSRQNKESVNVLIILLEDVSKNVMTQKKITQERNEKSLLLEEIDKKNQQLKRFNEEMQLLVKEEIKKNIEKQKMYELQSRHAQMGEMIAMITHQWKQPLNVINLIASTIKIKFPLGKLNEKNLDKSIDKIHKQVKHMNQTVHDFQEFFNPLKEKIEFNLKTNLLRIIGLVQYEYKMKNIELELIEKQEVWVYGFPNEYNQVILSLLTNAKEAFLSNPFGEMKIVITIDRDDKNRSVVTIKDNAGGIPEHILDTIFDIYMTTKETGSGLGLNIAKNIIEKNMNGSLRVKNIDNGAEFSIVL